MSVRLGEEVQEVPRRRRGVGAHEDRSRALRASRNGRRGPPAGAAAQRRRRGAVHARASGHPHRQRHGRPKRRRDRRRSAPARGRVAAAARRNPAGGARARAGHRSGNGCTAHGRARTRPAPGPGRAAGAGEDRRSARRLRPVCADDARPDAGGIPRAAAETFSMRSCASWSSRAGTLDASVVHAREVFKAAIAESAAASSWCTTIHRAIPRRRMKTGPSRASSPRPAPARDSGARPHRHRRRPLRLFRGGRPPRHGL
jgi:hypothetical protein